jgi:hypothetical protein
VAVELGAHAGIGLEFLGMARVTKLMMPPTFCGPKRTEPAPRITSTELRLPSDTGASDSWGWP